MNEIKLLLFGFIALTGSVVLFWYLDEPEIIEDKEIEIITTLGIGLLILIIDKRADHRTHIVIHEQHELIKAMHNMLQEQNELTKNIERMLIQNSKSLE